MNFTFCIIEPVNESAAEEAAAAGEEFSGQAELLYAMAGSSITPRKQAKARKHKNRDGKQKNAVPPAESKVNRSFISTVRISANTKKP